jgi:hypothetical protein
MQGHRIVSFFGPGLAMCDRCKRVVDVYEWSEPCGALAPRDEPTPADTRSAPSLVAS